MSGEGRGRGLPTLLINVRDLSETDTGEFSAAAIFQKRPSVGVLSVHCPLVGREMRVIWKGLWMRYVGS